METYKTLIAKIEKLKLKAEQIRQTEIKGVVGRIRDAMAHYGLTAEDLRLPGKAGGHAGVAGKAATQTAIKTANKAGKARKANAAANPGAPKYRDPLSAKTWTGRGKPPNWIVGVADRSAFLIAGSPAPAVKPAGKKNPAKSKAKRVAATASPVPTGPAARA